MAQAKAICKCERCGQSFTKIATKYNRREADEWVAWAEKNYTVCTDCYKAEKQAEEAAKAEKMIAEITSRFELPELTGSEKQIKWASDIRIKMVGELLGHAKGSKADEIIGSFLVRTTEAAWWIDHRDYNYVALAKAMAQ